MKSSTMQESVRSSYNSRKRRREVTAQAEEDACETVKTTDAKHEVPRTNAILQLNDDCLCHIFTYLNIWQVMLMEKVCKRFKIVARMIYKRTHELNFTVLWEQKNTGNITMRDVRNISARLAPHIHTLVAASEDFYSPCDVITHILDICKDCSKLKNLRLCSFEINQPDAKSFVNLEMLELKWCTITDELDLEICLQAAKNLKILNISCHSITGKCLTVLHDIKELSIGVLPNFRLSYFRQFCERQHGLKTLKIKFYTMSEDHEFGNISGPLSESDFIVWTFP
ncbi:uncharacterized protein LOC132259041 [Phlebotomus argentipes]|uniref:uncharacterized protein LOC132259041 n=1 Tax=Phlebotomus argentipes TaxID=94469 RepID=UPI002892A17A|nr:uncharacterized protein LOC132259041 [Phlebotomus argentipes]